MIVMPYVTLSGKYWVLSYAVDGDHFPILRRWGGNLLCETTGRERLFDLGKEEWDALGCV
jgi:hypothetical protein